MNTTVVRTALFVPATRPERIPKALASGADAVIVDLEDAVESGAKDTARKALTEFLAQQPTARVWVRINSAGTAWHDDDLQAVRACPGVQALMLPKAESLAQVQRAAGAAATVVPLIESALGLKNVGEIAAAPGVERLAFGSLDYGLDLRLTMDTAGAAAVLDHARCEVLLHGRVAGLGAPLDGVYPDISDAAGLKRGAARARDMGFGGMLCIHPAQIQPVHEAFAPRPEEIEWARRVLQAWEADASGAVKVDGKMVDAPVVGLAMQILARIGEAAP
jgi:(S)-citramalyl-CoA lyase